MPRFMLLVKATKESEAGIMPSDELISAMTEFNAKLAKEGRLLDANGLHPSSEGFRVTYENGSYTVTDGPFPETKELIAGYWLIEAKSLQEAVDLVKQVPGDPKMPDQEGQIEIRPLYETEDFPENPDEKEDGWRAQELEARENPPTPARKPGTRRYLGMVMADASTEAGQLPSEELLEKMCAFIGEASAEGVFLGGDGLKPSKEGARVHFSSDKIAVTDGPFAETKELVAGYGIDQYSSREEAIEWTMRFIKVHVEGTGVDYARCEVRPIFEFEEFRAGRAVEAMESRN